MMEKGVTGFCWCIYKDI